MSISSNRAGLTIEQFAPIVSAEFRTGVAGFLAPVAGTTRPAAPEVRPYTSWHDFAYEFRAGRAWRTDTWRPDELVWSAVQGYFANGGVICYVAFYDPAGTGDPLQALDHALEALSTIDDVDLVCAPSVMASADPLATQRKLIESSEAWRRARFAQWFLILDAPESQADVEAWLPELRLGCDRPYDIALYHPWLIPGGDWEPAPDATATSIPPCGHVAGIYARSDRRVGVHKPPANEEIIGVVDVASDVAEIATANAILAMPGRGIRVWGARTLAVTTTPADPFAFVNMRRLLLTLERWLVRAFEWVTFETNDFRLWVRIHRELEDKLTQLFQAGAFAGKSPSEAFRIKCDEENNSADARANGVLQVDVDVAPAVPQQFIKIRLVRSAGVLAVA